MEIPLEIAYHGLEKDETVDKIVRNYAASLEDVCDHLVSCRIVLERPHAHQESGNPYRVRILVRVPPGQELVVKRETSEGDLHDHLIKVVSDAFDAMTRKLRETVERQQGQVKEHPEQQVQALVVRIFKDKGFGFLKTPEGREIYFHENSVLHGDFRRMEPGTGVRFAEELGEEGPQATSVAIINKPGAMSSETDGEHLEPPLGWES